MERFWRRWMLGTAGSVALFGLALTIPALGADRLFRLLLFGRSYPGGFGPSLDYLHFVHGVLGATMAGWAVLMIVMLAGPFPWRPAWWGLSVSLGVWFVADTALSLASGFPQNAVLNGVIAAAFLPGLIGTRPESAPGVSP
jgi:hypothetical protein